MHINNCRDVEKHIAVEDHGTRGDSKGLVNSSTDGTLSRSQSRINNLIGCLNIIRNISSLKGTQNVANSRMGSLDDGIGLRVLDCNGYSQDSLAVEGELKGRYSESTSSIINA